MTILQKITLQSEEVTKIFLFKEGMFYKAYNQGAFYLRYLNYKIVVKQVKSINQNVISVGFPLSVLNKIRQDYHTTEKSNNVMELSLPAGKRLVPEQYELWYKERTYPGTEKNDKITTKRIIEELKNYPLATKTPVETFMWLSNLQQNIINGNIY